MSKFLTFALSSCLFVLFVCSPTPAQTATATLTGTIEDQNGAALPGASIIVKNYGTALERTATTNERGYFTVPLLPPGQYTVTVRKEGFTAVEVRDTVLNVADQKALAIQLKVGDVNAAIEVRPDETLVSTSPAVSTTVDRTFVANLPLNGRSFQSLILLTPGIVGTTSDPSRPGEFSVNGQRQNANYFTVDGVSANTGVYPSNDPSAFSQQAGGAIPGTTALGTTASIVSIDALEEFKIQTSTYSSEFGRQPGAQVQLLTRSGSNDFHGTAFEYLRNDALDARDWFANADRLPESPLRQNQFGGTFSGPVFLPRFGESGKAFWNGRNKTFFFFSYEGQRLRIPVLTAGSTVPSLRLRQLAAPAMQPFMNAFPLPTGPEIMVGANNPFDPIDPETNPATGSGVAPIKTTYSNPSSVDAYSLRFDHTINGKLSLFGRYSFTPSSSLTRNLNMLTGTVMSARSLTLGGTMSVTPRLINEIRLNHSSNRGRNNFSMDNFGGAVPVTLSDLTSGYSGPGVKFGSISSILGGGFSGFQLSLGDEADNSSRQLNIVDNLTWVKGPHQLKFGIDWRRLNSTFGPFAFQQFAAFNDEASIAGSNASFVIFGSNRGAEPIYDNYSAYAQDTWKLSQRLTLDLGLRWEINPAPHDTNGLRPIVLTGIDGIDVSNATIAPPSEPFYKTFWTAFAPRFGVAYQISQTSGRETVLRGGFGVYYDLGSGQASGLFGRYPFSNSTFLPNASFPFSPALAQPPTFLPVPTQLPLPNQDFFALDPNLKLPYTLQWNVGLQQSLGNRQTVTLSYVASAARQLTSTPRLNNPVNPLDSSTRPNLNFGRIIYFTNGPSSDYHSLQAQYQRRLSHGLQALVNYTWAHAIDVASSEIDGDSQVRGNAAFDVRHNFSTAVTYDLPKFSMAGPLGTFLRGIANGWSVDMVFYARTGMPIDLSNRVINYPDGTYTVARPDLIPGLPIWITDPSVPGGQRLNPVAFQPAPLDPRYPPSRRIPARQGTLGRNAVYLPGINQMNMAVRRQFKFGERLNLQLKAEAFNVLNHPLFGSYGSSIRNPTFFGVPQAMLSTSMGGLNSLYQIGGPRSMQLSLRLSF